MAASNFISTDPDSGVPVINMPDPAFMHEGDYHGSMTFCVATPAGEIRVESLAGIRWECKGAPDALVSCGLIQGSWLPGLPGNAKVRQTVFFQLGQATLRRGKDRWSVADKTPRICVRRVAKDLYCVDVPLTPAQEEFLSAAAERHYERAWLMKEEADLRQAREEEEARLRQVRESRRARPAKYIRAELRGFIKGVIRTTRSEVEEWREAGIKFGAMDEIEKHLEIILNLLDITSVQRDSEVPAKYSVSGNIIRLRPE